MIKHILGSNIAIIGGGKICKAFLQLFQSKLFKDQRPSILGVADLDSQAEGILYAKKKGIFTTQDYRALYRLDNLQVLIELNENVRMTDLIRKTKPAKLKLIDHILARAMWSSLQLEKQKRKSLKELQQKKCGPEEIDILFAKYADRLGKVIEKRNKHYIKIERELIESERTMSQIVQGSTIPTFVINKDHMVTHWNNACEKLTGYSAGEIVGTNKQWVPFRSKKRPIMADLILDQVKEEDVWKYYGTKWQKSALIEGAYEAEEFFPHLGQNGKWLFFTAAPIKGPDGTIVGAIETLWDKTEDKKAEEERRRHNKELSSKARELAESEKTLSQIIQGSTLPTFVINKDHVVTHWNGALEKLSGYSADEIVGTKKQSVPFWGKQRPTMSDVILDQIGEEEIKKLYGTTWRKSALIEEAYEAEVFFPILGEKGKWCWFTAAPLKAPDGKIIGAIETLWDKTADKEAEQERERHALEQSKLISIYTALNAPSDIEERVNRAIQVVGDFLSADGICIFLLENDGKYHMKYSYGVSKKACQINRVMDQNSLIHRVAQTGKFAIYEDLPEDCLDEICFLEEEKLKSLAYIPIRTEEKQQFGAVRIGSKQTKQFFHQYKDILELICNRIGVTIENARLQEQYIKSEEKYRSLFNNDPNPIFIIDSKTLEILDTNQRAQDVYGYSREELFGLSFLNLGDESDEEIVQKLKDLTEDQSVFLSKKRHYKKGRRLFYVNISVSDAEYGGRHVLIATTTDITESIEKETQLIQAGKMTTLGVMAAGMAHEINQPLNVIQVCADFFLKMLKKGQPIEDEDLKIMASDIVASVDRAAGVIKHVRDFARQSEVVRSRININDPIKDVFKVLGNQLKVHQIEVELDLAPDIPNIMAEHNRLEQVFINLVTNAIDAMDEKSSRPDFRGTEKRLTIKSFAENGHIVVNVSDTGIGMSKEIQSKIFEPFFTTKKIGKGTGLGISISYGIVKDYDGTIEIESEVGKGSTFKLRFAALPERSKK
jgi:PAS domain S-box-containing protein